MHSLIVIALLPAFSISCQYISRIKQFSNILFFVSRLIPLSSRYLPALSRSPEPVICQNGLLLSACQAHHMRQSLCQVRIFRGPGPEQHLQAEPGSRTSYSHTVEFTVFLRPQRDLNLHKISSLISITTSFSFIPETASLSVCCLKNRG
jgi:hypothetical protein